MKSVISILFIVCAGIINAQSDYADYFTQIFPSPTGRKVIIVECDRSIEMPCYYSVISTRLYNLPLDCKNYIELNNMYNIQWVTQGTKFLDTQIQKGSEGGDNYVNTRIVIYDTLGSIFDTIMYAAVPVCRYNKIYFCREYDPVSKTFTPQIIEYDLNTKKETLLYKFDSVYTFWSEQVDCMAWPELRFNLNYPPGLVCVLFDKDNLTKIHTVVVDRGGLGVRLWKEGYHFNCMEKE